MGRDRVSGAAPRDHRRGQRQKAPPGLRLVERDGYWHVHGTCRVKDRSVRVRRGTGLPARPELKDSAEDILRQIEAEIRAEVIHGVRPTRPLGVAAREYLGLDEITRAGGVGGAAAGARMTTTPRALTLGARDIRVIQRAVEQFGTRPLAEIPAVEWRRWLDERHAGNAPETRLREVKALRPFLKWCAGAERQYLAAVPELVDPDAPRRAGRRPMAPRRRVAELRPDLLAHVFGFAAIHLRAQLYVEWSTAARVSSVLFGCSLADLVLTEKRSQITFHDTKNGDDVEAVLHPATVAVLREYLDWRGDLQDRKGPLFVTPRRAREAGRRHLPYSDDGRRKGYSGFNKTAFAAMKRRAIRDLLRRSVRARRAGELEDSLQFRSDARLIRQFTQHWLRHWFATHSMALEIPDRLAMSQAGWRDPRSLHRYQHDVIDVRRRLIETMPIGAPAPATETAKKEKA